MKCPKCHFDNPDSAKYCSQCSAPLNADDSASRSFREGPASPSEEFTPGLIYAGKYRIIGRVGEGGMGVIYKAEDIMLKRTVALKFLPLELTRDKEAKARFIREAQTAAPLDHPNICTFLNEKNSLLANIHGESRLKKLLQRVKREW